MIPEISATFQDSLVDHVTYEYNIKKKNTFLSPNYYSLIEMPHRLCSRNQASFFLVFFFTLSGKSLSINNEILKEPIDWSNTVFHHKQRLPRIKYEDLSLSLH